MKLKTPVILVLLVAALGAAGFSAWWTFFHKDGPDLTPEQRAKAKEAVSKFIKNR